DGITMQLKGADRRPSQEVPAAWPGQALDAGLHAADRNRAHGCEHPWILPSRHMQRFVQSTEIGPARRETDHGDAVIAADMARDDLLRRGAERFRDVLEVDA